ncbi:MAG: hypothetical protein U1E38_07235 [Rhodospirillales bacterium]
MASVLPRRPSERMNALTLRASARCAGMPAAATAAATAASRALS